MTNDERPARTEAENELQPIAPTSRQTIANTLVGCRYSPSPICFHTAIIGYFSLSAIK